ncbi:hypothetical protein B6U46_05795 [Ligilactobacillus salivarius]|uniref:hypothetical protein n=1 Tax=Ligilactobacillus salivarius TaxID=1624 RepID=UPI0009DB4940|nr:hypothetical protein [Ligilactobacillus salivarius]OQR06914.1 hypothetical protein B6U47_06420 [Ligilactobacillus salivarius]OQR07576.1 hypothetical protein B6U46_05795 [Ligilactobacillus salivarius]
MENIELLPEFNIDEVKTANRVEKFLLKAIPLFEAQSQLEQLQSPSLSGMPGGSIGNSTEEKILQKMGANDKLFLIKRAISYCPYNKNYILQELYLEGKPEPKINIGGAFNNGENGTDGKVDPVVSSIAARMKSI